MTIVASAPAQVMAKLPAPASALVGLFCLGVVAMPGFWALLNHFTRVAHEGTHAIVGSILDTRVTGVYLFGRERRGYTDLHEVAGTGFFTAVVGYFGPSGFGLAAADLIAHGRMVAVLWIGVALLIILLPSLRTFFGFVLVFGVGFLLVSVLRSKNASVETAAAYALSWLLLLSGVRGVWDRRTGSGDADRLRTITDVPQRLWFLVWLTGTVVALLYGSTLLV
jgi:Peptidase M50B-like